MARNDESQQDAQTPQRVRRASDVHRRRVDKETRREIRDRVRRTARDEQEKAAQEDMERQERFRVIHGGRDPREPRDGAAPASGPSAPLPVDVEHAETFQDGEYVTDAGDAPADAVAEDAGQAAEEPEECSTGTISPLHSEKPRRVKRTVLTILAILIAVAAILMGLFCWNRWLRYDDAAEIQGEWFAAYSGRRAPITIDGEVIVFNPETKWHYTLDTTAKTITFTFGSQSGGGRYRFANGHEHLIIEDGVGFTAFDTFMADLQSALTGQADAIPQGDTVTVLSRSVDAESEDGAEEGTSPAIGRPEGVQDAEGEEDGESAEAAEDAAEPEGAEEAAADEGAGVGPAEGAETDAEAGDGDAYDESAAYGGEDGYWYDDGAGWVEDAAYDDGAGWAEDAAYDDGAGWVEDAYA